jgi:thiosulfate/3-mercaptopyruvate sulfurtransferase
MLPTPTEFQTIMSKLGIKRTDNVLVYDQSMFSAPRIYWMLKVFGHENVSVLDGGMQKYLKDGGVLETKTETIQESEYPLVEMNEKKVIDYLEIMKHIQDFSTQEFTIIDARSAPRFAGHEQEPRPIPSGHCPGAINIPFAALLTSEGTYLEKEELRAVFEEHMVDLDAPIVNMCGSGVTACVVDLALDILEFNHEKRVFDGSWAEYAANSKSPIIVYPN